MENKKKSCEYQWISIENDTCPASTFLATCKVYYEMANGPFPNKKDYVKNCTSSKGRGENWMMYPQRDWWSCLEDCKLEHGD